MSTEPKISPHNLVKRMIFSPLREKNLWKMIQDYFAERTLEFLLKSNIMPKDTKIIADLLCGTGRFLKTIHEAKAKKEIDCEKAYGVDINKDIITIAEAWGKPNPIHLRSVKDTKEDDIPKADFICISDPIVNFKNIDDADAIFKGISQYAKKDSKIFLGLSCNDTLLMLDSRHPTTEIFMSGMKKYFNYELTTALQVQEQGLCKHNSLIADTYGGYFILTPKEQESSSSLPNKTLLE